MNSGDTREVRLRFSPHITGWIAEMRWHREEKKQIDQQGRLCLTIPVADFREIKREILKYGADVQVLEPSELREELKREIKKMALIYR
jgi:predicted DNA-binding transcriptional regulator YafY